MARWRLTDKHYLSVPGTEWEYKETGDTGKQKRIVVPVPQYLDPNDPSDWTHRELGVIIVCNGEGGDPRDIVFIGSPTQDMEPLDPAAEEITAAERSKWQHPIETLRSNGEGFVSDLVSQIAAVKATSPQPATGPTMEEFKQMQKQLADLIAVNSTLQQQLAATDTPAVRRP